MMKLNSFVSKKGWNFSTYGFFVKRDKSKKKHFKIYEVFFILLV